MERHEPASSEDGFSLIEVIVAMLLLALLALVTLPLFMTGLSISSADSARTSATDRVSAALEQLRSTPTCAHLQDTTNEPFNGPFYDAQHREFEVTVTVGSPSPSPCVPGSTVTVTASATRASDDTVLSTASTVIYVHA